MTMTQVGDTLPAVLQQARTRQATRHVRLSPHGKPIGRPTRLHEGLIDRIVDVILGGAPQRHAAMAVGVPQSTFLSWKARGRIAQETRESTGACPPGEMIYLVFLERIEEARAQAATEVVHALKRLALGETVSEIEVVYDEETEEEVARVVRFEKPSERAMEFYLERSHPEEFAKRVEVSGPDTGPIPMEVEVSARESIRKRLGQVADRIIDVEEAPTEPLPEPAPEA